MATLTHGPDPGRHAGSRGEQAGPPPDRAEVAAGRIPGVKADRTLVSASEREGWLTRLKKGAVSARRWSPGGIAVMADASEIASDLPVKNGANAVRLPADNRAAHALLLAGDFLLCDERRALLAMNPASFSGLDRVRLSRIAAAAMSRTGGQHHGE